MNKLDRQAMLELLDSFLDQAPNPVFIAGPDGKIALLNSHSENLFAYPRAELIGMSLQTLVPEIFGSDASSSAEYLRNPQPRPMGLDAELFGRRNDGTEFPVDASLTPVYTVNGLIILASIVDITKRSTAERSRKHLAALVESSDDAIFSKALDGTITSWNKGAEHLYGYSAQEIIGHPLSLIVPFEKSSEIPELLDRVARGEGIEHYETTRTRKDGSIVDVSVTISPIRDSIGSITGASVIARDISELKQAEERFRAFLEFAPDAIVMIDVDGAIQIVNAQVERLFGFSRSELVGSPVEKLIPQRFNDAHIKHRSSFTNDPRPRLMGAGLELYGVRKDGAEFQVEISLSPLPTRDGFLYAAAIRDVTERKRLERLRDEFIGNAAHELRTPLATLNGIAEVLTQHFEDLTKEQRDEMLAALNRQGERASNLISNLLDLSRLDGGRADIQLVDLEIQSAIHRCIETAPPPADHTIDVRIEPGLCVRADSMRFEQVIVNLLTNAYRYGGRTIHIETNQERSSIIISIGDDGAGVPADIIPSVFEPFTRGPDARKVGGSGIGLALCRRLIRAFGGDIWYEAAEPHGARFRIRLVKVE
ncbi:MAG: PAS domain-containing sensor histidine kinase [Actinomycetota bacterium]